MLSTVHSGAVYGVDVQEVEVEVRVKAVPEQGPPQPRAALVERFILVGLPDAAIRESRERVVSALLSIGFFHPDNTRPAPLQVTVSLAPADLRKSGALYDLPIALGMICARKNLPDSLLENRFIIGELGLKGEVRPIRGALAFAILAKEQGYHTLILPKENAKEASAVEGLEVIGITTLLEAIQYLTGVLPISPEPWQPPAADNINASDMDYVDIKGQEAAKRALTVAAAGNHNALMIGAPGSGKSMLARRLPGIMPPLSRQESLEVTKIHSIAGTLDSRQGLMLQRPFRDPHHTISDAGLIGGQQIPRPGELSLAHCGILFLDELPEFRRTTLEVLRQPLENGEVTISRASGSFTFPARVMLIAAMNPCPCGYYGSRFHPCRCSPFAINAYRSRLSGPLLDRVDIHLEVSELTEEMLLKKRAGENTASMREKVLRARKLQEERYRGTGIRDNADLRGKWLDEFCSLSSPCQAQLRQTMQSLNLSARAYDRILRVARTLADLADSKEIQPEHIAEAASYRLFDRPQ